MSDVIAAMETEIYALRREIQDALKIMRCDPNKVSLKAAAHMMVARHDQADLEKERKEFCYHRNVDFDSNWEQRAYIIRVWDNSVGEVISFSGADYDEAVDQAIEHFKKVDNED